MVRTQEEWWDWCMKKGTTGDMVFDILRDWEEDIKKFSKVLVSLALKPVLSEKERWNRLSAILSEHDEGLEKVNTCGIELSKNEIIQQQERIVIKTCEDIERLYLRNEIK